MKSFFPLLVFLLLGQVLMGFDCRNLLLNSNFDFHAFINHREGRAVSFSGNNVAYWNTDGVKDITVLRSSHVSRQVQPSVFFRNGVRIAPGKRIYQFFTLPEAGLIPGEAVSLKFYATTGIRATVRLLKFDSEDGTWSPSDFDLPDKRTFPKHSRGELVVAEAAEARVEGTAVEAQAGKVENFLIKGTYSNKNESDSAAVFAAGLEVEFFNESAAQAWLFAPSLVKSPVAADAAGEFRAPAGAPAAQCEGAWCEGG